MYLMLKIYFTDSEKTSWTIQIKQFLLPISKISVMLCLATNKTKHVLLNSEKVKHF